MHFILHSFSETMVVQSFQLLTHSVSSFFPSSDNCIRFKKDLAPENRFDLKNVRNKFQSTHGKLFTSQSKRISKVISVLVTSADIQTEKDSSFEVSIPVLSLNEVMDALNKRGYNESMSYEAMYSSVVGGITRELGGMVLPIDDHMTHRGHAVFDTALIRQGFIYELDPHLDRLLRSSSASKITSPFPRDELKRIIIETAAVSAVKEGYIRYWLSAGPGGFGLTTKECIQSTFYVIILGKKTEPKSIQGVKVITSSVPIKPQIFATVKSVNYLPNALVLIEAEEKNAFCGIWLDEDGYVGEGPSMNVAFVNDDNVLLVPEFDRILAGVTIKRVMDLAQTYLIGSALKAIEIRRVTVAEAMACKEMMLVGSGVQVESVVDWDGQLFSQGKPGPIAIALRNLLEEDMASSSSPVRIPILYK